MLTTLYNRIYDHDHLSLSAAVSQSLMNSGIISLLSFSLIQGTQELSSIPSAVFLKQKPQFYGNCWLLHISTIISYKRFLVSVGNVVIVPGAGGAGGEVLAHRVVADDVLCWHYWRVLPETRDLVALQASTVSYSERVNPMARSRRETRIPAYETRVRSRLPTLSTRYSPGNHNNWW